MNIINIKNSFYKTRGHTVLRIEKHAACWTRQI